MQVLAPFAALCVLMCHALRGRWTGGESRLRRAEHDIFFHRNIARRAMFLWKKQQQDHAAAGESGYPRLKRLVWICTVYVMLFERYCSYPLPATPNFSHGTAQESILATYISHYGSLV